MNDKYRNKNFYLNVSAREKNRDKHEYDKWTTPKYKENNNMQMKNAKK